ncbi:ATP-binding cassette domain-containing protein [Pyrobaculum ferrireducens]|uniref:ABC transporter n=1 Tax=Pyrobaculum ferrireducens TaxID=1104324 RepID=G7VIB0_9CREN|nr:ATP-binding cassette domain-containing protein [Pyrobaculum ferrireducens]AET32202.1 ABC transporter [Pyrobaculum ferrireducens]
MRITARKRLGHFMLDVDVEVGDRFLVVGPNGSGKSTLLKCMASVYTGCGGGRWLYVPPEPQLPRRARVREVAETYARVLGVEPEWDLFGVDYLNRRVGELSSGMAKRVVLAIAFSAKLPLALDEPTAFLDERWRRRLVELLRERTPAAVATHDPELIFSLPDWDAVVLEEGRARYVGKAEGLRGLAAYRCGKGPAEAQGDGGAGGYV